MQYYVLFQKLAKTALGCLLMVSCAQLPETQDPLERSLRIAEENRPEIEKVLAHYRQHPTDSLKLKAAIFLISNMHASSHYEGKWLEQYNSIFDKIGTATTDEEIIHIKDSVATALGEPTADGRYAISDLKTLKSGYLIQHIDLAFEAWQTAPWSKQVSFSTFCNFILPYKVAATESPESWRKSLRERYLPLLQSDSLMHEVACKYVKDETQWFKYSELLTDYSGKISLSNLMKGKHGDCSDMSSIAAYAGRALGLPVAIDYLPQWANYPSGHVWNALILNDSLSVPFLGAESGPGDYLQFIRNESKPAKVFRRMYSNVENSFAMQAEKAHIEDIPAYLQSKRALEVTPLYTPTGTVTLKVDAPDGKPVYLCIFQKGNWQAIAGNFAKNGSVTFENMGRDVVYLPMFYEKHSYQSAGNPILLPLRGDSRSIVANESALQTATLSRKFPLKRERTKWNFAEYYNKARIQGAHSPDFKDSTTLYVMGEPMKNWGTMYFGGLIARDRLEYHNTWEEVNFSSKAKFQYIRLSSTPHSAFKVGDLEFYAPNTATPLKGKPIGSMPNPERAFDGENGNSIILDKKPGDIAWVGLDLGQPTVVAKLRYLPANDKNQITPAKTYQLYYWTDHWTPLSSQKAVGHTLTFSKLPVGALFWLHCNDCQSTEERPFLLENGKQVWW
ncbi:MAG: discoidin domain-containing protein [Spirosomataceae bacterium]